MAALLTEAGEQSHHVFANGANINKAPTIATPIAGRMSFFMGHPVVEGLGCCVECVDFEAQHTELMLPLYHHSVLISSFRPRLSHLSCLTIERSPAC